MDALKAILPRPMYTLLMLAAFLFWIGYEANDVVAKVNQHFIETSKLVRINRATCKAMHLMAKLDPGACWRDKDEN